MKKFAMILAMVCVLGAGTAMGDWSDDFSTNSGDWINYDAELTLDTDTAGNDIGSISNVNSEAYYGVYTRLGGYSSSFGGGFSTSVDVYLDLAEGTGFSVYTAANGSDGNHQRDFAFHIGNISGTTMVNASTNVNQSLGKGDNSDDYYNPWFPEKEIFAPAEVKTEGWYTFKWDFINDDGTLAVDMSLLNSSEDILWSQTLSEAEDTIDQIGGNRYMMFGNISDGINIKIDNARLTTQAVPVPGSLLLCGIGLGFMGVVRRFRKK